MSGTGLVDTHAHFLFDEYVTAARRAGHGVPDRMPAWPVWSAEEHLALMDEAGVERAVLSLSSPGVCFGGPGERAALAREVNEFAAAQVAAHPARFGFFASLPLPYTDEAVAEARHALDVLGAAGFCVMSNADGVYLGDERFERLWALLDERGAVVFVHPTAPPNAALVSPARPYPMIEFVFDEARTVVDLLFAGILTRFPRIRFVVSHSGGALPVLLERIDLFFSDPELGGEAARAGTIRELVGRLWFDCAGTPLPFGLPALARVVGRERLLYGSDYCFTRPPAVLRHVAGLAGDGPRWLELMAANAGRLLGASVAAR
ncbi:putative TIM-barrel fold metal-dependent hydrolase [Thermocatellispora tengchongensis]|uniref:6-methylsalicylate decarboxylase n=1 Tax=Thermocatellispora tengchongensis TaxID=1073253 RepID=A0A840PF99_9ACTN|nr:amidohydrolase family protein [Thermocatellispora tengchongensis]MBB5137842.1 putative TIM-barrel fold metal-dependent hydrolase [Thermocatellispora tengchongensis]